MFGVSFSWILALGSFLIPLVTPGTLAYLGLTRFRPYWTSDNLSLPSYAVALVTVLALPFYSFASLITRELLERRRARSLGARVAPLVLDPSLIGVSTFIQLLKQFRGYPGPEAYWSFNRGRTLNFAFSGTTFDRWSKTYGHVFRFNPPDGETRLFTSEPEHIKAILATQFDNFIMGSLRFESCYDFLGQGVFNSDGDGYFCQFEPQYAEWYQGICGGKARMHRAATRPYFTRDRIQHLENFDQHAEMALTIAAQRLQTGEAIDFEDLVARFTLDSATSFLFGYDVQSLEAGLSYPYSSVNRNSLTFTDHPSNAFVNAFSQGLLLLSARLRSGRLAPLFDPQDTQIPALRKIIDPYIDTIIEQVLKQRADSVAVKAPSKDDETLLEYLLNFMQDPVLLRDEIINLLVAGRDTTASLLTYGIYALTQHPDVTARLRKEILEVVGPSNKPSFEMIKEMKYLRAFLNETLRLYSTIPFNARQAVKETVLKNKKHDAPDIFVPAGRNVVYSVFLMHRRSDLWGPDAHLFDPDRFIDERLNRYLAPNPFIFLPFNAGPRICLGQQFAYTEASYFMIKLLQKFDSFSFAADAQPEWSLPPKHWKEAGGRQALEKVMPSLSLSLAVKGGLWVRMREAGDESSKL